MTHRSLFGTRSTLPPLFTRRCSPADLCCRFSRYWKLSASSISACQSPGKLTRLNYWGNKYCQGSCCCTPGASPPSVLVGRVDSHPHPCCSCATGCSTVLSNETGNGSPAAFLPSITPPAVKLQHFKEENDWKNSLALPFLSHETRSAHTNPATSTLCMMSLLCM